jgi:hypothetical protein
MRFLAPQTEGERRARRRLLEAAAVDRSKSAAIDSGRLAEPFWYVDSPLTTPDASRPFAGRPPRGETPPPAPGILIPDMPIVDRARPNVRRLREIVRDGLLALVAPGADRSSVEEALRSATGAPRRAVRMERLCSDGEVVVSLGAKEGEVWLVRPDGYVAAVLRDSGREATTRAARRALQFGCATDPVC